MYKIYIAGPDVFEKNSLEIGEEYKKICEKNGCEGMYPLDNCCTTAHEIFVGNINLINKADVVIANGNEFRGEMDVGTAFEIGYAVAKGKPIYIYMDDTRSLIEKYGTEDEEGRIYEDFNHPLNLMLAESSIIIKGSFEDAVIAFMDETVEKRERANEILANSLKTDKEKLLEVFELFKKDVRNNYTMLYYALLRWRDSCRTKTSGSVSASNIESDVKIKKGE